MRDPLDPSRFHNHPALARVIESGRANIPTGVTTGGALSNYAQASATLIRDNRDREKREIMDLNNRLARYIEKVRFLAAQNEVLCGDIHLFQHAAAIHAQKIAVYFESEKKSLETLVRENDAKISSAHQHIRKLEPEMENVRKSLADVKSNRARIRDERRAEMKRLSDLEAENAYFKRLINESEEERSRITSEISRLRSEIKKVHAKRDKERKDLSKRQQTNQDFLKKINASITQHEMAIRDEITKARRDTTDKNREYFHKELTSAMKDIRDNFDKESRHARSTWEEWYRKKIIDIKNNSHKYSESQNAAREEIIRVRLSLTEFRNKTSDLETVNQQLIKKIEEIRYREEEELRMFEFQLTEKENAVIRMREECTKLSVQLDSLCDNNINLHNEISRYRKLIENAENLRTNVVSNVYIDAPSPVVMRTQSFHNHGSAFTVNVQDYSLNTSRNYDYDYDHYGRSQAFSQYTKGDVGFSGHSGVEQYITIENTNGIKSYDLSNWKLEHYNAGRLIGTFIFPIASHIQPDSKIDVFSRSSNNLLADYTAMGISSFEFSDSSKTILLDDADEEVGWYAHSSYNH